MKLEKCFEGEVKKINGAGSILDKFCLISLRRRLIRQNLSRMLPARKQ